MDSLQKMSVTAVVPARLLDSTIPNKNILPFANSNLLIHKLQQLLGVSRITNIIVSSDSEEILNHARSLGVQAILRPAVFSASDTNFSDFVDYIADLCPDSNILWAPVTAPLVGQEDFTKAIDIYFKHIDSPNDSLITVECIQRHLLDDNGPLTFRFKPSQRTSNILPTLYHYVNAISIAPKESIRTWRYNWGMNPHKYILPPSKSIEICSMLDYELTLAINRFQSIQ
jgi:N-acylneuraminate cytidylyltransferase